MQDKTDTILAYARLAPVIPVVTIEDQGRAVELARTLVGGGLPVIEVTLRTAAGLDAIDAIAREVPDAVVGAGTVTAPSQIGEVEEAGARFIVTPGTSPRLADALADSRLPVMPGCATPSEAVALAELGFSVLKFFPAGPSGGMAWLKAVHGPLKDLRFCPTGGVDAANAAEYLALPNVVCVGGSWVTPTNLLVRGDFAKIGELARDAAALPRGGRS